LEKYREFLSHARECEQLARGASNPAARTEWEKLAATWRSLARERREMKQLPPDPEEVESLISQEASARPGLP